jgi:CDP-paratose 2-epimerase
MTTSIKDPKRDFEINALGTLNLLESIRRYSPGTAVLFSSTNKVYGDLAYIKHREHPTRYACPAYPKGFPETCTLDFHSPYGCSKGTADQYMLDYHRIFGINTVVFRHSSMYGGRQFSTYDQGWIGWFCQKAVEQKNGSKEPFTISGSGKQVRDVLYASDIVDLYFKSIARMNAIAGQVFNIGGGMENSLSLLELFGLLERMLGVRLRYRKIKPRESDQLVFVADIAKAKKMIQWAPQVKKEDGLRIMLEWIKQNA